MEYKAKTTGILVLSAGIAALVLTYSVLLKNKVLALEEAWSGYAKNAAEISYTLSQIESNLGFGGFIHNFKNYVLRKDVSRVARIDQNIKSVQKAIERYRRFDLSEQEAQALNDLERVLHEYYLKFNQARNLVNEGYDTQSVDNKIRVDDAPALRAIEILALHVLDRNKIKQQEGEAAMYQMREFMVWGIFVALLVISYGIVLLSFVRNVVKAKQHADRIFKYTENLVEVAPDAMLVVNTLGQIVRANAQAERLFKYSRKELSSLSIEQLIPERFRFGHGAKRIAYHENPKLRPMAQAGELCALAKDGSEVPVEISLSHTDHLGELQIIATIRDVTERQKAEENLRLNKRVFESVKEAILVADNRKCVVDVNHAFEKLTGYGKKELVGKIPAVLTPENHNSDVYKYLWRSLKHSGVWQGEIVEYDKKGETIECLASISTVCDPQNRPTHIVVVYTDITSIKQKQRQLESLAHKDQLTQLHNRHALIDIAPKYIGNAYRHKHALTVMFIDIDHFKKINDRYGHGVGDIVISEVAETINSECREGDFAVRFGGEEFVVLLSHCSQYDALIKAEKLRIAIEALNPEDIHVTISIGVATLPMHTKIDQQELLNAADKALYEAKHKGRNCVVVADFGGGEKQEKQTA